jgi:hypothetical protein
MASARPAARSGPAGGRREPVSEPGSAPRPRAILGSMTSPGPATVDDALRLALDAYAALQSVAEEVEDEGMYVQDLTAVHRERLDSIAAEDGARVIDPAVSAAVVAACEEIARIADPHRAIDWLSTYPSIVAVALGREP